MNSLSKIDLQRYEQLVAVVGKMAGLYSESETAFVHSRFVERLFIYLTGARDLSRHDNSFDAVINDRIGVGIKTFITNGKASDSVEKVAEFTRNASQGDFNELSREELAHKVARMRNARILSVNGGFALDANSAFYHCLVRVPGGAHVHEEPYESIDLNNIRPTDPRGQSLSSFSDLRTGHVHFTDGVRKYMFNSAKNVLYQRFELTKFFNSEIMPIVIEHDILKRLESELSPIERIVTEGSRELSHPKSIGETSSVVLPLYSTRSTEKTVPSKSGINQWNAGGRARTFGEAYIPVPREIHKRFPDFFPPRDSKFRLKLPNGKVVSAKVCQDGSKALMADPNSELCEWLYSVIDGSFDEAQRRLGSSRPYSYSDLSLIGRDSVRISKVSGESDLFELESTPLGAYESFIGEELPESGEDE